MRGTTRAPQRWLGAPSRTERPDAKLMGLADCSAVARAFVAGFLLTTNLANPGTKKAPIFLSSLSPIAAGNSMTALTSFRVLLFGCCSAIFLNESRLRHQPRHVPSKFPSRPDHVSREFAAKETQRLPRCSDSVVFRGRADMPSARPLNLTCGLVGCAWSRKEPGWLPYWCSRKDCWSPGQVSFGASRTASTIVSAQQPCAALHSPPILPQSKQTKESNRHLRPSLTPLPRSP